MIPTRKHLTKSQIKLVTSKTASELDEGLAQVQADIENNREIETLKLLIKQKESQCGS